MSSRKTPNLGLRIADNLTADAIYNLYRIDQAAATWFTVNSNEDAVFTSTNDISFVPKSGEGDGGSVEFGSSVHDGITVDIWGTLNVKEGFTLTDTSGPLTIGGDPGTLALSYTANPNNDGNYTLTLDVNGANRSIDLTGNLSTVGNLSTSGTGSLDLALSGTTNLTVAPGTWTVTGNSLTQALTNKIIDADLNTISNITNDEIKANAGIVYSKLDLLNSIKNSDISGLLADRIVYNKLDLANQIINSDISSGAAISYSKLNLSSSIIDTDIAPGANISYSKLQLNGQIVNSDISNTAQISYGKLADQLTNQVVVTNSFGKTTTLSVLDAARGGTGISSTATFPSNGVILTDSSVNTVINKSMSGASNTFSNIPGSAVLPTFTSSVSTTGSYVLDGGTYQTTIAPYPSLAADVNFRLPPDGGVYGFVLSTDGAGNTSWTPAGAGIGSVTSVALSAPASVFSVSGSPIITAGTLALGLQTQTANTVWAGPTSGGAATPTFRALTVADMPPGVGLITSYSDTPTIDLDVSSGNLTANLTIAPVTTTTPVYNDELLIQDVSLSAVRKVTVQQLLSAVSSSYIATWTTGTSFTTVHSLATEDISVSIYDIDTGASFIPDTIVRDDINTITVTASEAPTGSGYKVVVLSAGSVAHISGGTGTVTSVDLSAPGDLFAVSGNPVIAAGTLTLSKVPATAATFYAGPGSGPSANPTFRSMLLTDTPSSVQTSVSDTQAATASGTPSTIVKRDGSGSATLNISGTSTNVTGVVAVANGGTNSSTSLTGNRLMRSSGGSIVEAAAITASRALQSDINGIPVASSVTSTELSYLSGVTSAIQTQLDNMSSTSPQDITVDVLVPTGYNMLRGETNVIGSNTITIEGTSTLYLF